MPETTVSIQGGSFLVNGAPTYLEVESSCSDVHGLLMNARFIQGVFDDKTDPGRFARWGHDTFDPKAHTEALVEALPKWYTHGLRAFTVGFQGGGPCFTVDNSTIHNDPFGNEGTELDPAYAGRMDQLIRGADKAGMVVIVSYFYGAQTRHLRDGKAIRNAVTGASRFLKEGGYQNVLIEIANEMNIGAFQRHPIVQEPEGMACLIDLARETSGGLPVGCSGGGGYRNREVAEASDFVLIHGNGCTRQKYYAMIREIQDWNLGKPIVCNEDSQCIGQLEVAFRTRTSWGYYNNATKQEPPADWSITPGEDTFFAHRLAQGIGIPVDPIPEEGQYYLQGLEPHLEYREQRWLRLACLYPEKVNFVAFYRNGSLYDMAYDAPFSVHFQSTWRQGPVDVSPNDREWKAVIHLTDGEKVEKTVRV